MALSWTMDKLGPICRSAEDCALVLDAIYGPDGQDNSVISADFHWDANLSPKTLRIGYVKSAFDSPLTDPADPKRTLHGSKKFDDAALDVFKRLGINLIPVDLPDLPYDAMRLILSAEAAASFDELTRSDRDKLLVQQGKFDWPNSFRTSRFIPAVDYVNANRLRSIAILLWDDLMGKVDVIVTPTNAANLSQLVATNLTGHPAVIIPNGFRDDGTPVSLTFLAGRRCARVSGGDGLPSQTSRGATDSTGPRRRVGESACRATRARSARGNLRSARAHDARAPHRSLRDRARPGNLALHHCDDPDRRRNAGLHGIRAGAPA